VFDAVALFQAVVHEESIEMGTEELIVGEDEWIYFRRRVGDFDVSCVEKKAVIVVES
jgi:hypothetical protein